MKILKKIAIITLIVIAFLGVAIVIVVRVVSTRALPDYSENIALTGITEKVTVIRDENAMPHIYASNEHDLYLASGYVMAQDRLWQMDLLRRVTMGRLSEIFGADMVKTDHLLRALQMTEKSRMVLERTDDSIVQHLNAFAEGINQYIEQQGSKLPPEFTILGYKPEPWQPFHTINLIGYMAWDLSGSWQNEVMLHQLRSKLDKAHWNELVPDLKFQTTYVHTHTYADTSTFALLNGNAVLSDLSIEIVNGSNNWAVTGKKSDNGKALMANDMHLGFGAPGIWYQIHQVVEGKLNVTGVALPGAPFIINGHNDSIGWGMTNLYVDEMDFFVEKVDEQHPDQYFYMGEWKPMKVKIEKIAVKGGDTIERTIRFTHHGPVISGFKELDNEVVAMRWTGNDYSNELRSVYLLNHAKNWNDFRHALTTMLAVSQNVVFADAIGNIGLQTAGGVPVRENGNGISLVPGDTDLYEWKGILPFDSLPFTYNPAEGFVSSANNRTVGPDYPYYIGYWFDNSSRIDRIRQMLESKQSLGVQDFMEMQGDQTSVFAQKYLQDIVQIIQKRAGLSANGKVMLKELESWDGSMAANSASPAVFDIFYLQFLHNVMADEMGEELFKSYTGGLMRHVFDFFWRNPSSVWMDDIHSEETESFEEMVGKAYDATIEQLTNDFGENASLWKWGKMHRLTLQHPLGKVEMLDKIFDFNRGPYEVGGSFHTVNPKAYNFHKPFNVVHGASQRHIFNMSNLGDSYTVIPTGVSGIPASPYYCNQTEKFLKVTYNSDHFLKSDVEKAKKYQMIFEPIR